MIASRAQKAAAAPASFRVGDERLIKLTASAAGKVSTLLNRQGRPQGVLRVEQWLESLGLCWQSFARSCFYSDSHNDLPLLEKVSQPVAVDPDDTLRAHAEKAGWTNLTLRQDPQ